MKLPGKPLRILGFTVGLMKMDMEVAEDLTAYGWVNYCTQQIRYCPADTEERIKDTVLHEIMHTIHEVAGLSEGEGKGRSIKGITEERRVKVLSTLLRKVMLDNPEWREYLFT